MFDLYIVVTGVLGLTAFLTLINLKLTLKQPQFADLKYYASKIQNETKRQPEKQSSSMESQQKKSQFVKTLFYLIKNFTFLDLILVRRARNKIPVLLSFSIQLALVYFFGFSFYFSAVGTTVNLSFLTVKLIAQYFNDKEESQIEIQSKKQNITVKNKRKLQILLSTVSLLLNMGLIWIFYKNFHNLFIISTGINVGIIFAIDNFAVKPSVLILISLPLSFSDHVKHFIDRQNQIVQILRNQRILKKSKKSMEQCKNPQKIFISTSHTENTLEIEPYVNLDPHENVLQAIKPSKIVQLDKISNVRKRPSKQYNGDNSSLSLFESHLPIKNQMNIASNLKSSQKNSNASPPIKQNIEQLKNSSFVKKKARIYTENLDFIDESKIVHQPTKKTENLQNEDPMMNSDIRTPKSRKFLKEIKFTNSAKKTFERNNQDLSNLKSPHTNDQQNILSKTQHMKDQNFSNFSYGSNFHGSGGKADLIKIYEDKVAQDLGQIDVNSPYRRRKPFQIKLDEINSKSNQTKNHKKFSLDPSKSILQQLNTSHFPDYLQKTYVQQSHDKKRRSFHQVSDLQLSRKSDAFSKFSNDSRISKSFKRTIRSKDPIVRQNDENRIPEFVIEDFTY